ncbi:formylglycine-generating enzyme family protein [Nocardia amamiensis]|uniref:formylglycine-generating enzyme family protein n=1 Tax=Nocardia amamiensis TaxID=404578 RepID=UPI001C3FB6C6|nr:formylglycine-generating enzyme family protein [Nocardia amamiensis]
MGKSVFQLLDLGLESLDLRRLGPGFPGLLELLESVLEFGAQELHAADDFLSAKDGLGPGCDVRRTTCPIGHRHGADLLRRDGSGQNAGMAHADLAAVRWRELSDESAMRVARAVARENDAELVAVYHHEYAGRQQRVALFERAGVRFSLVPADRVRLGYGGDRFVPSPHQAASYADSVEEYGLPAIAEFVDAMTSPDRVVELPAMFVGVEALEPCLESARTDDPRVQKLVAESGPRPGGTVVWSGPDGGLKVEFDELGQVHRAQVVEQISYEQALGKASALGVRASTPDEWEYACGAGASTLFRWGDDSPDDGYPFDHRTGPHRKSNLWDLKIGQDPYRHEFTTEPTIVCGGDGGGATCGGSGFFLGWLTLATAYRDKDFGAWLESDNRYITELLIRPVAEMA